MIKSAWKQLKMHASASLIFVVYAYAYFLSGLFYVSVNHSFINKLILHPTTPLFKFKDDNHSDKNQFQFISII